VSQKNWYAFHIYRNSRRIFIARLQRDAQTYYVAEQAVQSLRIGEKADVPGKILFPSIVFVNATSQYVDSIRRDPDSQAAPYTYPGSKVPAVISDREMQVFQFVLSTGCEQMQVVDEKLAKGDKVRVLDGVFKGAEGYIVRIKGDRRFVVSLQGITAVATTYIPQRFLEKLDKDETPSVS